MWLVMRPLAVRSRAASIHDRNFRAPAVHALLAGFVAVLVTLFAVVLPARADPTELRFGVGLYQPDKNKNDATYRPLARFLAQKLGRPVRLYNVDTWEGLARSLAAGETDIALMGPWGYVLANHEAGAEAVATILYDGKPEYFAIMITHPGSGIRSVADLKGKTFAFGDKGSTSGYLIPLHHSMGIEEPPLFSEPDVFLVRPDGTLYDGAVQTMPFARPGFNDLLGAVDFPSDKSYAARSEYTGAV